MLQRGKVLLVPNPQAPCNTRQAGAIFPDQQQPRQEPRKSIFSRRSLLDMGTEEARGRRRRQHSTRNGSKRGFLGWSSIASSGSQFTATCTTSQRLAERMFVCVLCSQTDPCTGTVAVGFYRWTIRCERIVSLSLSKRSTSHYNSPDNFPNIF
jgi:hypothetical protein